MSSTGPSRRSVLRGSALTVAAGAAGFLVARRSDAAKERSATTAANAYGTAPKSDRGHRLARLDEVPTGGGLVVRTRHVVLTRDEQGTVRGFSSTCTHQGCTVSSIEDGAIVCPCHGSRFDARTGSAVQGPATRGLREVPVVVRGDTVFPG